MTKVRISMRYLWNMFMAAVVFLPTFIGMARLEIFLRGELPVGEDLFQVLGGLVVLYIVMVGPVLLASLAHTTATFLIPRPWSHNKKRMAVIVLAFLIPIIHFLADLPGGGFYAFYIPTVISTVLYGFCARITIANER